MTEADLKPGCLVVKWDREEDRTAVRKCRAEAGGSPWVLGAVLCPVKSELESSREVLLFLLAIVRFISLFIPALC